MVTSNRNKALSSHNRKSHIVLSILKRTCNNIKAAYFTQARHKLLKTGKKLKWKQPYDSSGVLTLSHVLITHLEHTMSVIKM